MIPKTFKKSERLAKKKLIQELFSKGSSFYLYPIKFVYLSNPDSYATSHQVLVSVPKKNHKTAVARNKIKRRIKEAYRINKHMLLSDNKLLIAYIYTAKEIVDFDLLEKKLLSGLLKLNELNRTNEE